jgi:hypothetical protein
MAPVCMRRRLAIAVLAFALPVLPGKWAIGAGMENKIPKPGVPRISKS